MIYTIALWLDMVGSRLSLAAGLAEGIIQFTISKQHSVMSNLMAIGANNGELQCYSVSLSRMARAVLSLSKPLTLSGLRRHAPVLPLLHVMMCQRNVMVLLMRFS